MGSKSELFKHVEFPFPAFIRWDLICLTISISHKHPALFFRKKGNLGYSHDFIRENESELMVSVQEQQSSFSCLATKGGGGVWGGQGLCKHGKEKSREQYKKRI